MSVFDGIEESMEKRRRKFALQNAGPYDLCRRLIGCQHITHGAAFAKHLDEYEGWPAGRPAGDGIRAEMAVLDMLGQNKLHLIFALHALAGGSRHAAGSLARSVFESVSKSFYLMARPWTVKKFLLLETYKTWRTSPEAKRPCPIKSFLESWEAQELLGGDQITVEEFKKFRYDHKISGIREQVYDGKILDVQNQMYAVLSFSSHPDVLRTFTALHGTGLSNDFMKIMAELSFANLFLTANSQSRLLGGPESAHAGAVMRRALQDMGPQCSFVMYPNKSEYTDNLAIPIESLL